jgi:hypothetical protein
VEQHVGSLVLGVCDPDRDGGDGFFEAVELGKPAAFLLEVLVDALDNPSPSV